MQTFGGRLKDLRSKAGLTVYEVAERADVWHVSVFGYERDAVVPSLGTAVRLAKALRVPLDAFADCLFPVHGRPRRAATVK